MNIQINSLLKEIIKKKKIKTRFCPEPSGFLHVGHLKNFYINYFVSKKTNGKINIRLDDSNPNNVKKKFLKNIPIEIFKLGFKKKIKITRTSFYFKRMYKITKKFIKNNDVYIDTQNKIKYEFNKGNYFRKGIDSNFKNRKKIENLYLFKKMKNGIFKVGEATARLKIKMNSKNICMRDPVIYRLKNVKKKKKIFPTYDFCNSICDRLEKINYSICSKEFENNKDLFNYIINKYNILFKKNHICYQIELSRINIEGIKLQKRKIKNLITEKKIKNWGDIRLLTLQGMKNRGYSNDAIKDIVRYTGFTNTNCKIKKKDIKEIVIKRMRKQITKNIDVFINPVKITNILNNKTILVEKKKPFFYVKKGFFFFLKKKKKTNIYIKCKSLVNKNTTKYLKSNKIIKLKIYNIINNKINTRIGICDNKNIFIKNEIIEIRNFGIFRVKKQKPLSIFEIELY
ncbi:glutamate--tRNA ligase family protein [Candidatus Vidania fulgoroideorum]